MVLCSLIYRAGGRRASQMHADFPMTPVCGVKASRRISTGMVEGSKNNPLFRRRYLASTAENLSEEDDVEGVGNLRGRSASEGTKAAVFRMSEDGPSSSRASRTLKKITFDDPHASMTVLPEAILKKAEPVSC